MSNVTNYLGPEEINAYQNTGGGGSHNNMQPYILTNYIIKT